LVVERTIVQELQTMNYKLFS